ncbi:MAG: histone-like nucleoid-structuring protein, MvaT/MvaU family [Hafnia sp.]
MSLIHEYVSTEQAIKDLQLRIDQLRQNPALAVELEFKNKLETLMNDHDKTLRDVVNLLDPSIQRRGVYQPLKAKSGARRERRTKLYKNPHNGEVIETKGGNHKALHQWKEKWGADVVESWASYKA